MVKNIVIFFCLILFLGWLFIVDEKNDNKNVIKFASWGTKTEVELIKPLLKNFEKENPLYTVEFIHIPENYFQKIHLLFASNSAPDVVLMNNLYLPFFAQAGVLEELDYHGEDFEQKALDAMSYKGKLYGIPRDISTLVVYINKDLFKKYNVKLPDKSWNFDDLLNISKKLTLDTNNDGKTDIWGIGFEEKPPLYYLPFLMSEGGGILSDDLSKIIFDSPQSQKGLKFYSDLRNRWHVAPTKAEIASVTMAQLFLNQKLSMQISGRWLVPKYTKDADFDWDIVKFPSGDVGSIVPVDASGWCITKQARNKKGAQILVKFLSSPKNISEFSQSGLIIPAVKEVLNNNFIKNKNSVINNSVFVEAVQTGKVTPVSSNYNEIQDLVISKTDYLFNK